MKEDKNKELDLLSNFLKIIMLCNAFKLTLVYSASIHAFSLVGTILKAMSKLILGHRQKPPQNSGWQIHLQWDPFKHVPHTKPVKWPPRDILRLVLGLGSWVCECVPSVSLPYKSDYEWKRGWYHDNVRQWVTSESLCEKVFGCISRSLITAKNPGGNQQISPLP